MMSKVLADYMQYIKKTQKVNIALMNRLQLLKWGYICENTELGH